MFKKKEKKKSKLLSLAITLIAIAGILIFFNTKETISHTTPELNCEYRNNQWECKVSFGLKNHTRKLQTGKLSIRGMAVRTSSYSSSVKISDEKVLLFSLNSYETKIIEEIIYSKKKPNQVNITIIENNSR